MSDSFDGMAEAQRRIAEEAERRTGRLDLSGLGLADLPENLFELAHLRMLDLGAGPMWQSGRSNQINEQRAALGRLTALEALTVTRSNLASLDFAARLTGLRMLDCSATEVADLGPLAGLNALQTLDCASTQVVGLAPLAGLTKLQAIDCSRTQVDDLTAIGDLAGLQSLGVTAQPPRRKPCRARCIDLVDVTTAGLIQD